MKNFILLLSWVLIPACLFSQDTSLPAGKAFIILKSDKIIKNVTLWKIDTNRIEYIKEGNLTDILTSEVSEIETESCFLLFDETNHYRKVSHDYFVTNQDDTTFCSINDVSFYYIYYYNVLGTSRKRMLMSQVKSYKWNKDGGQIQEAIPPTNEKQVKPEVTVQETAPGRESATPLASISTTDTISSIPGGSDYFYNSYNRGVEDGMKYPTSAYWVGGFLLGMTFGSYLLTGAAINEATPLHIPDNVDQRLYIAGYEKTTAIKKGKSAANGASTSKLIIFFIILFSIGNAL